MSRFARRFWLVVGILIVVLVLVGLVARSAGRPKRNSVLEVRVTGEIPETAPAGPFGTVLGTRTLTLLDYVAGIRRARDDRRIRGLILTIDAPRIGFAKVQELRDAVRDFQKSGKWAVAFMETAGEFAPGNKDYYLATACPSMPGLPCSGHTIPSPMSTEAEPLERLILPLTRSTTWNMWWWLLQ